MFGAPARLATKAQRPERPHGVLREPLSKAEPLAHSILVVEDEPMIRRLFADVLADEGFEVRLACDGLEALEAVGERCPDLVLLDLQMPRLDGLAFLEVLDKACLREFPVIIVSGNGRAREAAPMVEAVLQKPVDLDVLLQCVARLLRAA